MIVTAREVEQPFASVTVQVQVPAASPVTEAPLEGGVVFHVYASAPVPPVAVIVALPVLLPVQSTFALEASVVVIGAAGWLMLTGRLIEQPFPSVIVAV